MFFDKIINGLGDIVIWNQVACYYYIQAALTEDPAEKIEALSEVLKLFPDSLGAHNNRAMAYEELAKQYRESKEDALAVHNSISAIEDFDEAIRLSPELAGIYLRRGITKCHFGLIDDAIADARKAISLAPDQQEYKVVLGKMLFVKAQQGERPVIYNMGFHSSSNSSSKEVEEEETKSFVT